jgi:hypothetical protein
MHKECVLTLRLIDKILYYCYTIKNAQNEVYFKFMKVISIYGADKILYTRGACYLPYSFLISFVMGGEGGSGPSRVIKFLYSPAPPPPPPQYGP